MTINMVKRSLAKRLGNMEEAKSIIEYVTGFDRMNIHLYQDLRLNKAEEEKIEELAQKREQGYPLQYLIGKWTFMDNDYYVGEGVLIPRDDTEVLVRSVIPYLQGATKKNDKIKIIDLCSGSGIIPVTLKKMFPNAEVHSLELSKKAIPYLKKNINNLAPSILLHQGDLNTLYSEFQDNYFDLIISNPPYIRCDELFSLQKEVQFEPRMALDGGDDGLVFYRSIIDKWSVKLKKGGMLAMELGENQFESVHWLMEEKGFKSIKGYLDLGDIHRAINGTFLL